MGRKKAVSTNGRRSKVRDKANSPAMVFPEDVAAALTRCLDVCTDTALHRILQQLQAADNLAAQLSAFKLMGGATGRLPPTQHASTVAAVCCLLATMLSQPGWLEVSETLAGAVERLTRDHSAAITAAAQDVWYPRMQQQLSSAVQHGQRVPRELLQRLEIALHSHVYHDVLQRADGAAGLVITALANALTAPCAVVAAADAGATFQQHEQVEDVRTVSRILPTFLRCFAAWISAAWATDSSAPAAAVSASMQVLQLFLHALLAVLDVSDRIGYDGAQGAAIALVMLVMRSAPGGRDAKTLPDDEGNDDDGDGAGDGDQDGDGDLVLAAQAVLATCFPHRAPDGAASPLVSRAGILDWPERLAKMSPRATIGFCRGALSPSVRRVLSVLVPMRDAAKPTAVLFDPQCVLAALIPHIHHNVDPLLRLTAMETLVQWTDTVCRVVSELRVVPPAVVPPLLRAAQTELFDAAWGSWDDPHAHVANTARHLFTSLVRLYRCLAPSDQQHSYLLAVASRLVALPWDRKGLYGPLMLLLPLVGVAPLLRTRPGLIADVLNATKEQHTRPLAADLLADMLLLLKLETVGYASPSLEHQFRALAPADRTAPIWHSRDGLCTLTDQQLAAWRETWLPPLLDALFSSDEALRRGVATGALFVALSADASNLQTIREAISARPAPATETERLRASVALLRQARGSAILDGPGLAALPDIEDVLRAALTHSDDALRIDAFELLAFSPRTADLVTDWERGLLLEHLPISMKSGNPSFRSALHSALARVCVRLRDSTLRNAKHVVDAEYGAKVNAFLCALLRHSVACMYPGASFQRKVIGLDTIRVFANAFLAAEAKALQQHTCATEFVPLRQAIHSPATTLALVNALLDPWDAFRGQVYALLRGFPAPLPGLDTVPAVQQLLAWCNVMLASPKLREADAGARLLSLLLQNHVLRCGWSISLDPATGPEAVAPDPEDGQARDPHALEFLRSLMALLQQHIASARADIARAARTAPMHGVLTALRYALTDAPLPRLRGTAAAAAQVQTLLQQLTQLADDAIALTLGCITSLQTEHADTSMMHLLAEDVQQLDSLGAKKVVMVACWLTIKEACFMLGALAQALPPLTPADDADEALALIRFSTVEQIGALFLRILFTAQHSGAIDKATRGFVLFADWLYRSTSARALALPPRYLNLILQQVVTPTDVVVRRSAGLPFALAGLLRPEPQACRGLFPVAMTRLLAMARDTSPDRVRVRVHALNSLRFLVKEPALGTAVSEHISAITMLVLDSMGADAWAVRNAANLTYHMLMNRLLRGKRDSDEFSVRNGIPIGVFFFRHPPLYQFLLTQLDAVADVASSGELPPTLLPTLLLLAKLGPSQSDTDAGLNLAAFVPRVLHCCALPQYAARDMAARALVPLVSPSALPDVMQQLVDALPASAPIPSHNAVHGILLMLHRLALGPLRREAVRCAAGRPTVVPAMLAASQGVLTHRLSQRLWLLTDETVPRGLRYAVAGVLDAVIAATAPLAAHTSLPGDLTAVLVAAASAILAADDEPRAVFAAALRARAATVLLQHRGGDADVAGLLRDSSIDVRLTALRHVMAAASVTSDVRGQLMFMVVAPADTAPGAVETDMQARVLVYRAIRRHGLPFAPTLAGPMLTPLHEMWTRVAAVLAAAAADEVRESAIELLGFLLRHLCCVDAADTASLARLDDVTLPEWLEHVEACGAAAQPPSSRHAVVVAVRESGLLLRTSAHPRAVVRLILALLPLLQDEDESVRAAASELLSPYARESLPDATVPDSVMIGHRLIQCVYQRLAQQHADDPLLLLHLLRLLALPDDPCAAAAAAPADATAPGHTGAAAAARVVFERECDNEYEEPLLLLQLAAHSLHQMLRTRIWSSSQKRDVIEAWRRVAVTQLARACACLLPQAVPPSPATAGAGAGSVDGDDDDDGGDGDGDGDDDDDDTTSWIGGMSYHDAAFRAIAQPALALCALAVPGSVATTSIASMHQLQVLFQRLRHGVIQPPHLYLSVLLRHCNEMYAHVSDGLFPYVMREVSDAASVLFLTSLSFATEPSPSPPPPSP